MDPLTASSVLSERLAVNDTPKVEQRIVDNLAAALAISQQHGGQGVALLVKGEQRYAAVDQSHQWAGHTALLLLLQELPSIPANPEIYVIGDLSESDLGAFLPLVKWFQQRRIHRWKDGVLFVHNPAMQDRWRLDGNSRPLEVNPAPSFMLSAPPLTGVSLFALLRPALLVHSRQMDFSVLTDDGQRLFDYMFLSLCASLLVRGKDIGKKAASIGAVIVNKYGEILSYGNDQTAELHAETVTIKRLQGSEGGMPDMEGCRFYTSLEPCMMCSGLIYESCVHNPRSMNPKNFKVIYLQWDPAVHQVEIGNQKITGIPTVLNERGCYDLPNQPQTMYALEEKRLKLNALHQQKPAVVKQELGLPDKVSNPNYLKRFEKSAVKTVEFPHFRRQFAKMKLQLLAIPAVIDAKCHNHGEREFLLSVWINLLRFLTVDCGEDCAAEMKLIADYLAATQGKNPLRQGDEGYPREPGEDFLAFYEKYITVCQVFPIL